MPVTHLPGPGEQAPSRTWLPIPIPDGWPGTRTDICSGFSPAAMAIRCTMNRGLPVSLSRTTAPESRSVTPSMPPTISTTPSVSILNRMIPPHGL